jgi:nitroreductase
MEFGEVVARRRSTRKFREDPVSDELLSRILEAGRWAPSAGNSQPWHFIVVTEPKVKRRIAQVCTESSKKAWSQFPPERAKYLAQRGGSWDKSAMAKIPALVAVCCETPERMREELVLGSAWTAIQNMLLAATSEGLGSCIYTFYDMNEEEKLKEILQVPEKPRIAAIIQLGYSRIDPPSPSRKKLGEIVSHQHF